MVKYYENKKLAEHYVKYRPKLNVEVAECLMSFYKTHQLGDNSGNLPRIMVDVGCGSGQSTNIFHSYFDEIIGIDVSKEQLNQARKQNMYKNIQYLEGNAENLPLASRSVDFLASTMAAHWFNLPQFFKEAERVLKPSGCLAIVGYFTPVFRLLSKKEDHDLAHKAGQLYKDILFDCTHKCKDCEKQFFSVKLVEDKYKDIFEMIPFS